MATTKALESSAVFTSLLNEGILFDLVTVMPPWHSDVSAADCTAIQSADIDVGGLVTAKEEGCTRISPTPSPYYYYYYY